jgi:hypothetical protein
MNTVPKTWRREWIGISGVFGIRDDGVVFYANSKEELDEYLTCTCDYENRCDAHSYWMPGSHREKRINP